MKNHLFSENLQGLNLVAIGGGNGLSTLLSGLKNFVDARKNKSRLAKKTFGNRRRFGRRRKFGQTARRTADAAAGRYSQLYGRFVGRFASAFKTFPPSFQRRRRTRRTQFRQSFSRRAHGNHGRFCRSRQTFVRHSGEQRSYLSGNRCGRSPDGGTR